MQGMEKARHPDKKERYKKKKKKKMMLRGD